MAEFGPKKTKTIGTPVNHLMQKTLSTFYKAELIHSKEVNRLSENEIEVVFNFKNYERTKENLGHVSMAQIHEALLEGLYLVISNKVESDPDNSPITEAEFQDNKEDAIYRRENLTFREMLRSGENSELTFRILEIKNMGNKFYSVTVRIDGFVRGEIECLFPIK